MCWSAQAVAILPQHENIFNGLMMGENFCQNLARCFTLLILQISIVVWHVISHNGSTRD